jgi:hypothetical protein
LGTKNTKNTKDTKKEHNRVLLQARFEKQRNDRIVFFFVFFVFVVAFVTQPSALLRRSAEGTEIADSSPPAQTCAFSATTFRLSVSVRTGNEVRFG